MDNFIERLSKEDKKTLSQKTLKLVEEVGELSKAVLPYDSAPGTNHRFVDKKKLLEEIADVYLTNISIAYSLNIKKEDIDEMIFEKAKKWSEIQSKESQAPFPLPYEIHITVENNLNKIHKFRETCKEIGVKPIVLDLELNDGVIKDIMTSSKHFGDNKSAYLEAERIKDKLFLAEFKVKRVKIETVPWHPAAPTEITGGLIPHGCYFESHIGVLIEPERKEALNELIKIMGGDLDGAVKLSRNFFKKAQDGKFVNMVTYRDNMTNYENFKNGVDTIKWYLDDQNFDYEKVEVEYSIYDTNVSHDKIWMLGEKPVVKEL